MRDPNTKGRCIVFCAGEAGALPPELLIAPSDLVIACDGGLETALALGITPGLIMGDFDSCQIEPPAEIETLRFLPEKDDTDSMLALREGLRRGYTEFLLLFSLGNRLDHTFANLQTLLFLEEQGAHGMLIGPQDMVRLVSNECAIIPYREGYTLSVFALGEALRVTLRGVKYPLEDATLTERFPIGLGNEILDHEAVLYVGQGRLLVIESRLR